MTIKEIAKAFSNGEFEKAYSYISDNAEWNIVEQDQFIGKHAIVEYCNQIGKYFKSVQTKFETINILEDNNTIAITGTAEFLRDNKRLSFVSSCDIYNFDENKLIKDITSYCIQSK